MTLTVAATSPEMRAQGRRVSFTSEQVRQRRSGRVHSKQPIVTQPRMNVEMEVRDLLIRARADRVPKTQTLIGKGGGDRPRDAGNGCHQSRAGRVVELPNVSQVLTRNDERVTGVKLPQVDERQSEVVFPHDARRQRTAHDLTEGASHRLDHLWVNRAKNRAETHSSRSSHPSAAMAPLGVWVSIWYPRYQAP